MAPRGGKLVQDGGTINKENAAGTFIMGRDNNNKAKIVGLVNSDNTVFLKTQEEHNYLLRELLEQQKITNKYLSILLEIDINELNI